MNSELSEDDRDELLGEVVEEFFQSMERGESPNIEAYMRRYPSIADLLKVAVPAMHAAEHVSPNSMSNSASNEIPPDKQLGDFRLLRQLGRGGMGIVYEAEQISMGRRVAVKVLPFAGLADEQRIQRFRNEVRAVAALDHPNIVSVYTVGQERGVHYFAMQMIQGRSLAEVVAALQQLRDEKSLDRNSLGLLSGNFNDSPNNVAEINATELHVPERSDDVPPSRRSTIAQAQSSTLGNKSRRDYFRSVATLGVQAANALQHAHDQGVIHRDIKPGNLLVDSDAKLYVTDFGLARMESDTSVTMTGDLIGTLRYMAPEQALAKRVLIDHRADIYSLAVTLYELLTLRPAYLSEDRQELLKQIAFEEPVPLRRVDSQIPPELEIIIHKAMAKDRDDRYRSAKEFSDDLQSYLNNRPITAKPPTVSQRVTKWVRRNPTIAWSSMVTLSLVTVAFAVTTFLVASERDEAKKQLQVATVLRLAGESGLLHSVRPILSILTAAEAMKLSPSHHEPSHAIAHAALLNTMQRTHIGRVLNAQGLKVADVAFNEQWLITQGNREGHLWDLNADAPWSVPISLGDPAEKIDSIRLGSEGRWLVTHGDKLRRWDLDARNPAASKLELADQPVSCVSLDPTGRWLAAEVEFGVARIWDLNASSLSSKTLPKQDSRYLQIVTNGRWVAASSEAYAVQLLDLKTGETTATVLLPRKEGWWNDSIALSPDGRWLALADNNQNSTVAVWDLHSPEPKRSFRVLPRTPFSAIGNLKFTPDSNWLFAVESYTGRIHRWDLNRTSESNSETIYEGHRRNVEDVSMTRDSALLVSGGLDGTVRLWNVHSNEPSAQIEVIPADDAISAVAVHPKGDWFATVSTQGTARLWDRRGVQSALSAFVLRGPADEVRSSLAVSKTGRWIATTNKDQSVQLWDTDANERAEFSQKLVGPSEVVTALKLSANDRWLVAGCRDGTGFLWDLNSQDTAESAKILTARVSNHGRKIEQHVGMVAICPNNRWLAFADIDYHVRLWDLSADTVTSLTHTLKGHKYVIQSMEVSPDGRWLASGGDADVRLWDLTAGDIPSSGRTLPGHTHEVYSIAFDESSRWLATSGSPTVRIWDLSDPSASPRELQPPPGHSGNSALIWRMSWSPDRRWLFTARFDRSAQLFDLSQKTPACFELPGIQGVMTAAMSSDSRWLATGSSPLLHLWDLTSSNPAETGRVLRGHEQTIWSLDFSSDSRWLVSDANDSTVRRWSLDLPWLLQHARDTAGRDMTLEERKVFALD